MVIVETSSKRTLESLINVKFSPGFHATYLSPLALVCMNMGEVRGIINLLESCFSFFDCYSVSLLNVRIYLIIRELCVDLVVKLFLGFRTHYSCLKAKLRPFFFLGARF